MRRIKLGLVVLFGVISLSLVLVAAQKTVRQKGRTAPSAYRENNCVICHASLVEPVGVSAHFYEWRNSKHEKSGVGCEKCHGGDPTSKSMTIAHEGVLAPTFAQSKLNPRNLSTTCRSCHQDVVDAFVKSTHYQKLQDASNAPSCTNCHHHMATSVITWPPDTAALCAKCHRSTGVAASSAKVPTQAGETIAAFSRADGIVEWARSLILEGKQKKLSFRAEENQLQQFEKEMKEAKSQWHAFNLGESRRTADEVFRRATEVKDNIWKRLPE